MHYNGLGRNKSLRPEFRDLSLRLALVPEEC